MSSVPFSKLTGTTLGAALRKSIREQREAEPDMTTAEGQLIRARQRGLRIVEVTATGQRGWVTQELNYGCHLRVRIAGPKGNQMCRQFRVEDLEFVED